MTLFGVLEQDLRGWGDFGPAMIREMVCGPDRSLSKEEFFPGDERTSQGFFLGCKSRQHKFTSLGVAGGESRPPFQD